MQKFTFCGIYRSFTFYPHGNQTLFVLHYLDSEDFELEVVHDILAPHFIKYYRLEYETGSDLQLSKFNIDVMVVKKRLFVYKFVTKKTHYISISLSQNKETLSFDGPGFLSEYTRVNTISVLHSSSFICFLQITQFIQKKGQ